MSFATTLRRLLPRAVRPHRIRRGPLRGSIIFASWSDYPRAILGRAEPELIDWLQGNVRPGETWLDVGAHYGYTALALSRLVGEGGRVFAFEPILATAGQLARTREANGLERLLVVPVALGDEAELTLFQNVCLYRGMAHMKAPAAQGEPVYSIALDALWPRLCGEDDRVSGVKIDVQGQEVEVVRGMLGTLRRHRPRLIVEYHGQADVDALRRMIEEAGYEGQARSIAPGSAGEVVGTLLHAESYEFRSVRA